MHEEAAPFGEYVPPGHGSQYSLPLFDEKVPAGQE
jgi:hypothetical protein